MIFLELSYYGLFEKRAEKTDVRIRLRLMLKHFTYPLSNTKYFILKLKGRKPYV